MPLDLDKFRNLYGLPPGTTIHAGASICQEKNLYRDSNFEPVLWIEALSDLVTRGVEELADFPNQTIHELTLWSEAGLELDFHRSSNDGQSSSILKMNLHRMVHPGVEEKLREKKLTSTLDAFLNEFVPEVAISLLVLDLQGAELEALKGCKENFYRINAIYTEVSNAKMYKKQPLFRNVDKFLATNGFQLIEHDMQGRTIMGDALYIRADLVRKLNLSTSPFPKRSVDAEFLMQRIYYKLVSIGVPRRVLRNPASSFNLKKRKSR